MASLLVILGGVRILLLKPDIQEGMYFFFFVSFSLVGGLVSEHILRVSSSIVFGREKEEPMSNGVTKKSKVYKVLSYTFSLDSHNNPVR